MFGAEPDVLSASETNNGGLSASPPSQYRIGVYRVAQAQLTFTLMVRGLASSFLVRVIVSTPLA